VGEAMNGVRTSCRCRTEQTGKREGKKRRPMSGSEDESASISRAQAERGKRQPGIQFISLVKESIPETRRWFLKL